MNTETFLWALLHCWICSKKWIFFSSSHLFQVLLFLRHLCSNFGLGKNKKFRGLLAFYTSVLMKVKVKSLSHVWLFLAPWTVAYQAPPSMGFSRQEYWTGLPFPSPGDLPDPGVESGSPGIAGRSFTIWTTREAFYLYKLAVTLHFASAINKKVTSGTVPNLLI